MINYHIDNGQEIDNKKDNENNEIVGKNNIGIQTENEENEIVNNKELKNENGKIENIKTQSIKTDIMMNRYYQNERGGSSDLR